MWQNYPHNGRSREGIYGILASIYLAGNLVWTTLQLSNLICLQPPAYITQLPIGHNSNIDFFRFKR